MGFQRSKPAWNGNSFLSNWLLEFNHRKYEKYVLGTSSKNEFIHEKCISNSIKHSLNYSELDLSIMAWRSNRCTRGLKRFLHHSGNHNYKLHSTELAKFGNCTIPLFSNKVILIHMVWTSFFLVPSWTLVPWVQNVSSHYVGWGCWSIVRVAVRETAAK